jgi:MFS transporter, DHA1 family, staphyloferrin A biosynthesis exporter
MLPKETTNRPFRGLKTFDSLKYSAYRIYFLGMIGQWSTFTMEMVARTYLVYDITGSAAKLGIMSLANAIPTIVFSLVGGAIADRLAKKFLIIIAQVAMMLASLGYGIAVHTGYLTPEHPESWWILVVGSAVLGTITAMSMPARQAIISELVRPEHIMNAVSLGTLGMSVFQLIGPASAGYIIDGFGYSAIFYIMAALNASGIIFAAFLPRAKPSQVHSQSVFRNIQDGLKYIFSHKTILLILVLFIASIVMAMPYQMMMPVFAKDILKVGVSGQGTLMSMAGFGALGAALILASIPSQKRGAILLLSNLLLGLGLVVFAFSVSWPLSITMMVFVGIGMTGNNTAGAALMQSYSDPVYLGRVMSVMSMSWGLSGIGAFFAGILTEQISAPWTIGGLAICLATISFGVFIFVSWLRKLD